MKPKEIQILMKSFQETDFNSAGVTKLAQCLAVNQSLRILDLSVNFPLFEPQFNQF